MDEAQLKRKLEAAWRRSRASKAPSGRIVHRWRGKKFVTTRRAIISGFYFSEPIKYMPTNLHYQGVQLHVSEFAS